MQTHNRYPPRPTRRPTTQGNGAAMLTCNAVIGRSRLLHREGERPWRGSSLHQERMAPGKVARDFILAGFLRVEKKLERGDELNSRVFAGT